MKDKREKVFSIRFTENELEFLKKQAECIGQTVGGYIRWIIFGNKEV